MESTKWMDRKLVSLSSSMVTNAVRSLDMVFFAAEHDDHRLAMVREFLAQS